MVTECINTLHISIYFIHFQNFISDFVDGRTGAFQAQCLASWINDLQLKHDTATDWIVCKDGPSSNRQEIFQHEPTVL